MNKLTLWINGPWKMGTINTTKTKYLISISGETYFPPRSIYAETMTPTAERISRYVSATSSISRLLGIEAGSKAIIVLSLVRDNTWLRLSSSCQEGVLHLRKVTISQIFSGGFLISVRLPGHIIDRCSYILVFECQNSNLSKAYLPWTNVLYSVHSP